MELKSHGSNTQNHNLQTFCYLTSCEVKSHLHFQSRQDHFSQSAITILFNIAVLLYWESKVTRKLSQHELIQTLNPKAEDNEIGLQKYLDKGISHFTR